MTNRRTFRISVFAVGLVALFLPVMASAQGGYDPYGRNRGSYGRYDERYLRDSIHRLDRLAKEFERDVDRALDRSRQDGTRREDRINHEAFPDVVEWFRSLPLPLQTLCQFQIHLQEIKSTLRFS